jgi:hypothetical protein
MAQPDRLQRRIAAKVRREEDARARQDLRYQRAFEKRIARYKQRVAEKRLKTSVIANASGEALRITGPHMENSTLFGAVLVVLIIGPLLFLMNAIMGGGWVVTVVTVLGLFAFLFWAAYSPWRLTVTPGGYYELRRAWRLLAVSTGSVRQFATVIRERDWVDSAGGFFRYADFKTTSYLGATGALGPEEVQMVEDFTRRHHIGS